MKYGIIVDSTVYLSEAELRKFGIRQVSLNIIDKDETFKELEVENEFVLGRMENGSRLTTSQPSPGEFLNTYTEMLEKGYEKIFVVTLAKPLSGTYQSALLAKNMLDDPSKIELLESKMAAFGNEMLVLELAEMIENQTPFEQIKIKMNKLLHSSELIFTIENLFHIARSGRLSKAKALVGSVLRVKPLIKMVEGKLDMYHTERTHKKVVQAIVKHMVDTTKDAKKIYIRVLNHHSLEQARLLEEEIVKTFHNIKLTFTEYLGPVFSLHLGTNGYGVSWCSE